MLNTSFNLYMTYKLKLNLLIFEILQIECLCKMQKGKMQKYAKMPTINFNKCCNF